MATKAARRRAIDKYRREKIDRLVADVPKGTREIYKQSAAEMGMSLSKLIQAAVEDFIARNNPKT